MNTEVNGTQIFLSLKPGHQFSLDLIAEKAGIPASELERELKEILDQSYKNFGSKAFALEYVGSAGTVIRSESHVGVLRAGRITIELNPKIPGFNIGKALGMAQEVSSNLLKLTPQSKIMSQISQDEDYKPLDVIAFPFLDSVETIFRNGIARKFEEVIVVSNQSSGTILFQEWIEKGLIPPPVKSDLDTSYDILPNRIIVAALTFCLSNCKNLKIKNLCRTHLSQMVGVSPDLGIFDLSQLKLHKFSLPRNDYERCLYLSLSILGSFDIKASDANTCNFIPSVIVDLDRVFEEYCSNKIKKYLNSQKFVVSLQSEILHPSIPPISGFFKPDLVIKNKNTGKSVVLDLKNKYSKSLFGDTRGLSNPDIFQLLYYSRAISATAGLLVYPAVNPKIQFPVRTSESDKNYDERIKKFEMNAENNFIKFFNKKFITQTVVAYEINLGGTMADTIKSIVSLCLLIERLTS